MAASLGPVVLVLCASTQGRNISVLNRIILATSPPDTLDKLATARVPIGPLEYTIIN